MSSIITVIVPVIGIERICPVVVVVFRLRVGARGASPPFCTTDLIVFAPVMGESATTRVVSSTIAEVAVAAVNANVGVVAVAFAGGAALSCVDVSGAELL